MPNTTETIPYKISFKLPAYWDVEFQAPAGITQEELLARITYADLSRGGEEYIPEDGVKNISRNKSESVSLITCIPAGEEDWEQIL